MNAAHVGGRRRHAGVTLMELLVVMAVVAILAGIAYPAYQEYVQKARRAEGRGALEDTAQQLERCYSTFGVYNNVNCPAVSAGAVVNTVSAAGHYTLESKDAAGVQTLAATTFTLRVIPQGTQANDTRCAMLTLDSAGTRGAQDSGGADTTADCW